jgi:hypothetical protein
MLKVISVILAVVLFLSSVLGLLFLFGYVGDSAARVTREHSLTLASSFGSRFRLQGRCVDALVQ